MSSIPATSSPFASPMEIEPRHGTKRARTEEASQGDTRSNTRTFVRATRVRTEASVGFQERLRATEAFNQLTDQEKAAFIATYFAIAHLAIRQLQNSTV